MWSRNYGAWLRTLEIFHWIFVAGNQTFSTDGDNFLGKKIFWRKSIFGESQFWRKLNGAIERGHFGGHYSAIWKWEHSLEIISEVDNISDIFRNIWNFWKYLERKKFMWIWWGKYFKMIDSQLDFVIIVSLFSDPRIGFLINRNRSGHWPTYLFFWWKKINKISIKKKGNIMNICPE